MAYNMIMQNSGSVYRYERSVWIGLLIFAIGVGSLSSSAGQNVTGIRPTSGAPGTSVRIYGSGFNSTPEENEVVFGGSAATIDSASNTVLYAEVPSTVGGPTSVSVTVDDATKTAAQLFTVVTQGSNSFAESDAGITGVVVGSSSWGDYDGDGDLDLLVTGRNAGNDETAKIYQNKGSGKFSAIDVGLMGVGRGSSDWGDYDSDGDLDLLVTGENSENNQTAVIYRNDGSDSFTAIDAGLEGVWEGSAEWGDFNQDGNLDVVVTGEDADGNPTATIYENLGEGDFSAIGAGLTNVQNGSADWGDYDGDGDLDLVVTGWDAGGDPTARVYRNESSGSFSAIGAGLTGVNGSCNWGDYDQDGDLDLVLTGQDKDGNQTATIYENRGSDRFDALQAGLVGVQFGSSRWGDFDGDADLDLVITGQDGTNRTTKIYRNDGSGVFTVVGADLSGVDGSSSSWGDSDGDGDLDLIVTGWDVDGNETSTLYENKGGDVAPALTSFRPESGTSGTQVRIYGAGFDLSPGANRVKFGNEVAPVDSALSTVLYARVPEDITGPVKVSVLVNGKTVTSAGLFDAITGGSDSFKALEPSLAGGWGGSVDWGDYDGDADKDLVVTGRDSDSNPMTTIYRNEGDGTFNSIGARLTGVALSSSEWGDYDGDGDLDLVVTGRDANQIKMTTIYENDTSETFRFTAVGADLGGVWVGSSDWGDFDRDGDLDLVVTGEGGDKTATIYRNEGDGTFTAIGAGLTGVDQSSSEWGDYDGDGDLDLVITGQDESAHLVEKTTIYENKGSGMFTPIGARLTGVHRGSSDWGDHDQDGDLDLVVTGTDANGNSTATIYRNDGGDVFTPIGADLTGVDRSSSAWGDFDGDGDLDLIIAGQIPSENERATAIIYRNQGDDTFTSIGADLVGVDASSSEWADYDGDGDLDLVVNGSDDSGSRLARVYENTKITTSVPGHNKSDAPSTYALFRNYPNPFNPATVIRYQLPQASRVSLQVFDVLGRRVRTLVDKRQPAGVKSVQFEAGELPGGIYFYRIQAGSFRETQAMMLLK